MKKLLIISTVLLFASCQQEKAPKDYAVIHGKISNPIEGTDLRLFDPITSESIILEVDASGNFRDTLKLQEPVYFTTVYENVFSVYLENDMDLQVDFDGKEVSKSISYSGQGSDENNFLRYKAKTTGELMGKDYKEYLSLEGADFDSKTAAYSKDLEDNLESNKEKLSPKFIASEKVQLGEFQQGMKEQHEEQLEINAALSPGMPSPEFTDYLNYKGGKNSLADYKGKYVYFDVWATWCVPCIYEMPFMKEIEKEYEGKNIHFIGLSIDRQKDEDKWRKMIVEKELMGTQLLADNEIDSKFIRDYYIQGIPRFILLDPEGNIVSYDAPRPSEPRLKDLFNSLEI